MMFVTVNFMCQLAWAKGYPDSGLKIISMCVCEGISGKDQHLKWRTMWVVLNKTTEGLEQNKKVPTQSI